MMEDRQEEARQAGGKPSCKGGCERGRRLASSASVKAGFGRASSRRAALKAASLAPCISRCFWLDVPIKLGEMPHPSGFWPVRRAPRLCCSRDQSSSEVGSGLDPHIEGVPGSRGRPAARPGSVAVTPRLSWPRGAL